MSTLDARKNFSISAVSTGYDASAVSIVLVSGGGAKFPNPATDGSFNLVWWNATDYENPGDDPDVEIVRCTARSSNTLTITRGQESTVASAKNIAGKTYKVLLGITAKMITDIEALLDTAVNSFVDNETVDGSDQTFTLAFDPVPGSVHLYGPNVRLKAGTDYSISGKIISTVVSWAEGEIVADYRKQI